MTVFLVWEGIIKPMVNLLSQVQICEIKPRPEGRRPGDAGRQGRVTVPAGGAHSPPLSGGSGALRPAGTMTGLRGNPLNRMAAGSG